MTEQSPSPEAARNLPEYTVSELSVALKRTLEDAYSWVRVKGEVSGLRRPGSGHVYFDLKDEAAVLSAVCWRGVATHLKLQPEDGMEVVCTGRVSTYQLRSQYQIVVESVELAGEGALLKLLEERRQRLAAEGLFAAARKRPLPFLPEVIGVVTSPTGAVIRDILHRISDRFPRRVVVWPVLVQGEDAAEQVAAAIEGFNRLGPQDPAPRPDVLIVARGGGSLEDLMPFNEEVVVRAAASSGIPLISAIGHETDTTLIDFAADKRAPTPSAAAEMAVPVRAELLAQLLDDARRLVLSLARFMGGRRTRVEDLARGLPDPRTLLEAATQRLDDWAERLGNATDNLLARRRSEVTALGARLPPPRRYLEIAAHRVAAAGLRPGPLRREIARGRRDLHHLAGRLGGAGRRVIADAGLRLDGRIKLLESCSYERVLERGFALVRDARHRPVTSVRAAKPGLDVAIRFHDGEADATIRGAAPRKAGKPDAPRRRAPVRRAQGRNTRQGTLL